MNEMMIVDHQFSYKASRAGENEWKIYRDRKFTKQGCLFKVWNLDYIFEKEHHIDKHELTIDSLSISTSAQLAVVVTRSCIGKVVAKQESTKLLYNGNRLYYFTILVS